MSDSAHGTDLLVRAFKLAYFIHGDKKIAIDIAAGALSKLEVACAAQDKRLYYSPVGRASSRGSRSKVSLSEPHLLQRLVYIGSEPYEKQREQANKVDEEIMTIHFVKHLVKTTIKRNSFYVTLGLSRLLHNYSTSETAEIYNLVVQNPDRVRDDYYYRSRKACLMKEIKDRFEDRLTATRGHRGEERFQSQPDSGRFSSLVRECLDHFTPWDSPCVVPERLNPREQTIARLDFNGADPDEEHRVETDRLHSVIHPDCYLRLVTALGLESPDNRLEIPQFLFSENRSDDKNDRRTPPPLDENDLALINRRLTEQSARRKFATAGLMRITVDGKNRALLDPLRCPQAQFEVRGDEEIVEVVSDQTGLLMATLLLDFEEMKGEARRAITLEGGQRIEFSISFVDAPFGEAASAVMEASYQETGFARDVSLAVRRRMFALAEGLRAWAVSGRGVWKPALALIAIMLLVGSVFLFLRGERNDNTARQIPQKTPEQSPSPEQQSPQPKQAESQQVPQRKTENEEVAQNRPDIRPKDIDETSTTRSTAPSTPGVTLREVKRISVEVTGGESLNQQIRDLLIAALQASGKVTVVASRAEADAVLKVHAAADGVDKALVYARLVNAPGFVLWPQRATGSGAKFIGTPQEVASRIAGALTAELETPNRR
ncbi:MAG: hypothetical protein AB1631_16965 [Acidobacteriota bacterium]